MTNLVILKFPDNKLRIKAAPVTVFDAALKQTVADLYETMYEDHGVGLAAIQVNIPQRILVMDVSDNKTAPVCLINPEIIHREGKILWDEGCLSFPGVYAKVERSKKITVKFMNEQGAQQEADYDDLASVCVQHEIDHLDGIVFIDYLSPLKRERLVKKMEKLQRHAL